MPDIPPPVTAIGGYRRQNRARSDYPGVAEASAPPPIMRPSQITLGRLARLARIVLGRIVLGRIAPGRIARSDR
jgi:hypothetical protein